MKHFRVLNMQDTLLENDAIGSGLKFDFYDDLQGKIQ